MASVFSGGAWSAPAPLDTTGQPGTSAPEVATDGKGTYIATWLQGDVSGIHAYAPTLVAGGAWSAPVDLHGPFADAAVNIGDQGVSIAMNSRGQALLTIPRTAATLHLTSVEPTTYRPPG